MGKKTLESKLHILVKKILYKSFIEIGLIDQDEKLKARGKIKYICPIYLSRISFGMRLSDFRTEKLLKMRQWTSCMSSSPIILLCTQREEEKKN